MNLANYIPPTLSIYLLAAHVFNNWEQHKRSYATTCGELVESLQFSIDQTSHQLRINYHAYPTNRKKSEQLRHLEILPNHAIIDSRYFNYLIKTALKHTSGKIEIIELNASDSSRKNPVKKIQSENPYRILVIN